MAKETKKRRKGRVTSKGRGKAKANGETEKGREAWVTPTGRGAMVEETEEGRKVGVREGQG